MLTKMSKIANDKGLIISFLCKKSSTVDYQNALFLNYFFPKIPKCFSSISEYQYNIKSFLGHNWEIISGFSQGILPVLSFICICISLMAITRDSSLYRTYKNSFTTAEWAQLEYRHEQ